MKCLRKENPYLQEMFTLGSSFSRFQLLRYSICIWKAIRRKENAVKTSSSYVQLAERAAT